MVEPVPDVLTGNSEWVERKFGNPRVNPAIFVVPPVNCRLHSKLAGTTSRPWSERWNLDDADKALGFRSNHPHAIWT